MSAWLDALFGRIFNGGVSLPLSKGINFANGLAATFNQTTKSIDVSTVPSAPDAAVLAPLLRGTGLYVSNGKLSVRPRPRRLVLTDSFIPGGTTSGNIGELGWFVNVTASSAVTITNRGTLSGTPGTGLRFTAGAVDTARISVTLGSTESSPVALVSEVGLMQTLVCQENQLSSKRFFFGMQGDFSQNPDAATDNAGIIVDFGDSPNYQVISRVASVGSPVISSTAYSVNAYDLLTMKKTPTGDLEFRAVNAALLTDNLLTTIAAANLPTVGMNIGYRVEISGASVSRRISPGLFLLEGNLTGAAAADSSLEA